MRRSSNREAEFESVFRQSRFSDRLRLRRLQRNNIVQENNGMEVDNSIDTIIHTNNSTFNDTNNTNTNPLIELLSDIDTTSENESISEDINENIGGDIGEVTTESVPVDRGEEISMNLDNSILEADLISLIDLNGSMRHHHQNIVENLTASNDHIDRATNLLELAQAQNRWVLFGLGTGFVVVAGLFYWIGYRAGLSRSNVVIPHNSSTIHHRKRSLKIIWNLLIDQFKR